LALMDAPFSALASPNIAHVKEHLITGKLMNVFHTIDNAI
jgi:hypothetical protein